MHNGKPRSNTISGQDTGILPDAHTAAEIARLTAKLDAFLEPHTAFICPSCDSVCCRNRFASYDAYDRAYLAALGIQPPDIRAGIDDEAPCQFLGTGGCGISRPLRPHRCNWFFCGPLLDHISQASSAAEYRWFITLLREICLKRTALSPAPLKPAS